MANYNLAGKVIALTGGASGIGLATATLLAQQGARVSIADVQAAALDSAKATIQQATPGAEVLTAVVDVRNYAQVEAWITATIERFGRLDGAANVAGVETDPEDWDFVVAINLTGVMHSMKAQMRVLADGGAIVNVSSVAGITALPYNGVYAASKHGVIGLTRSVAKEAGSRGIRVNCVCPGLVKTPMLDNAKHAVGADEISEGFKQIALGRAGEPEEVGNLVCFLLSDGASFISGSNIVIDGGYHC